MSFNGVGLYQQNLAKLMESDAFKKADDAQRLELGYRLLKSKYGLGSWFGLGRVHALPNSAAKRE